ncbi:MAG: DUF445 family protein [Spirochaetaceae bacterium]|jgi:hypothetical protein|nr:DUF445 family protein [Spirochaetaceae bacterium]
MKALLGYLIPPLVGAVIGFVTNAVAIKMLFRPLKEIRLFAGRGGSGGRAGIRLPFTPGILPRQRHKLADSIGAMVERELLTPEIVQERLRSDSVRQGAARSVSRFTERLSLVTLGKLKFPSGILAAPACPETDSDGKNAAGDSGPEGARLLMEILRDFSRSPVFAGFLDVLLGSLLETALGGARNDPEKAGTPLAELSIPEILGKERTAAFRERQDAVIRETLSRKMAELPLGMGPFFFEVYPAAVSALFKLLDRRDIRLGLEIQGRIFLDNAIQKLSAIQRFFISAGQYDRTLSERMPEIIDDLIGQLETLLADNAVRRRASDYLANASLSLAAEPANYERLVRIVSDTLFSLENRPVGELLGRFGINGIPDLAAGIRRVLAGEGAGSSGIKGKGFASAALAALETFFAGHAAMTLGEFFSISGEKKGRADKVIMERLLSFAERQTESVLKTIDIRAMVTARIDSLDMLRVEHIVLDVLADQLKWINFFGAILGALIGGTQVLVSAILG